MLLKDWGRACVIQIETIARLTVTESEPDGRLRQSAVAACVATLLASRSEFTK